MHVHLPWRNYLQHTNVHNVCVVNDIMMSSTRVRVQGKPSDRFIPFRPFLNIEISNYRLRTQNSPSHEKEAAQYKDSSSAAMSKLLNGGKLPSEGRVLPITEQSRKSFDHAASWSPYPYTSLGSTPLGGPPSKRDRRHQIPSSPECVMDMPNMRDDFYTNLLDWGHKNLIAVALNKSAYIWHAVCKECQRIEITFPETEEYFITALCWKPHHDTLAIADTEGEITICDMGAMKTQRKLSKMGKKYSIGSLLWTDNYIIGGNRRGKITIYDQRGPQDPNNAARLFGHHGREVCGLTYRAPYLASGGDDGLVNIWDLRMNRTFETINAHTACAKALAWCPWRPGIIASGGGSSDGYIRLWNVNNGEMVREVFTKSQVCSLLWSHEYAELVSSHGTSEPEHNDIVVWDMTQLQFDPLTCLRQHVARPLHLAMSPDETTVASAGADEALCLWKLFPKKTRKDKTKWDSSPLNMFRSIR